jgi:hypothetical protein
MARSVTLTMARYGMSRVPAVWRYAASARRADSDMLVGLARHDHPNDVARENAGNNDKPVNPEHWLQIERIYHLALERPPREREAFLKNECHGDDGLRLEVHSLLRQAASAENFLDEPAVEIAATVTSQSEAPAMPETIGYRDPHTVGPALWAQRQLGGEEYEASTCPVVGDVSLLGPGLVGQQ